MHFGSIVALEKFEQKEAKCLALGRSIGRILDIKLTEGLADTGDVTRSLHRHSASEERKKAEAFAESRLHLVDKLYDMLQGFARRIEDASLDANEARYVLDSCLRTLRDTVEGEERAKPSAAKKIRRAVSHRSKRARASAPKR